VPALTCPIGQAGHLVPCGDELGDDVRTGMAGPPVTNTCMLLLLVNDVAREVMAARVLSREKLPPEKEEEPSADLGAQGEVEAGTIARQPHQQEAGRLEDRGRLQPSCVEGPQLQALQERRDS
jgi:hypothetical protein